MAISFEKTYPTIADWVNSHGWIELGHDDYSHSFIRALDEGGLVWEGDDHYATLGQAFEALEAGLAEWMQENGT